MLFYNLSESIVRLSGDIIKELYQSTGSRGKNEIKIPPKYFYDFYNFYDLCLLMNQQKANYLARRVM